MARASTSAKPDDEDDAGTNDIPAEPEAEGRKPKAIGDLLIALHRGGPYNAARTIARPPGGSGVGKTSPQERYEQTTMQLLPGLNLVKRDLWNTLKGGKGLNTRIDVGEIEKIGGFGDLEWPDQWARIKPRKCSELVEGTASIDVLQQILDKEQREEVAEAISVHLEKCRGRVASQQMTRQTRRTANRRNAGRR